MTDRLRITVGEGKYTVVQAEGGGLSALRYGEPWRDCVGDGLILALAQEVESLREAVNVMADMLPTEHKLDDRPHAQIVGLIVDTSGKLWINVDGKCSLRIGRVENLSIEMPSTSNECGSMTYIYKPSAKCG